MRAVILAAGVGARLGDSPDHPPKALLRFGGKSLLARHLEILSACGIGEIVIGVGYRAGLIEAEIASHAVSATVRTVHNTRFRDGSIVTLQCLSPALTAGGEVLVMDADVLYDRRMIERLIASRHANCFLLDRDIEPGEEPMKICVQAGRIVDFHKKIRVEHEYRGESVGFFRFSPATARSLAERAESYVAAGRTGEMYEEAIRDELLDGTPDAFGFEDVTGLPWIEIDFPEDIARAEREILPRLADGPR